MTISSCDVARMQVRGENVSTMSRSEGVGFSYPQRWQRTARGRCTDRAVGALYSLPGSSAPLSPYRGADDGNCLLELLAEIVESIRPGAVDSCADGRDKRERVGAMERACFFLPRS
jgi:hypothetical protein